jgi:1-deoxy-D-xylulose 5-phosphate reductoisomerase
VNAFLKGKIGFLDIERVITETLSNIQKPENLATLEDIQQFNQAVIEQASKCL